ncbi:MAG: phosphate ABC transporter substrate-binding protein [Lachnospiraceae bacterium]|nr:phosphate ABC transporter substrate-binding protein [Lachnospiraceae bacterium]
MKFKKVVAFATVMAMTMSMAACGSSSSSTSTSSSSSSTSSSSEASSSSESSSSSEAAAETESTQEAALVSGKVSMSGSTSMEKYVSALIETYAEINPNITVTAEYVGSGAGIEQVIAGSVDIGNSSRNLKDAEMESGAVENIVAIDGIAVVVDPANTVDDLTQEELVSIYTGEITNWSELGGSDTPIVVIGREAGSGTRGAFEELLGIEDVCAYASELDSTGAVIATVAATEGAIGYASLDSINDTVVAVKLDGVEATEENIVAGDYFLCRPFVMATNGEISEQSEAVQAWFEFVYSDEGKAVAQEVGLITVD